MLWPLTLGALTFFLIGAAFLSATLGRQQERRARYMSALSKTGFQEDSKGSAKQRTDVSRRLKEASKDKKEEDKKGKKVTLRHLLQQAGYYETPLSRYWLYTTVFSALVGLMIFPLPWPNLAKIFVMITAFFGLPKMYLKRKADRRQRKFLEEFADALDAMVRLLQAGMPMSEAIAMGSREFTGPLKEEMTRVYEDQKLGTPIGEAALGMARRVPLTEAHMFATALQIQSETGSSLSEVLTNLSGVIRARFRLKRKVKALSSEAKSSAAIIGCMPVLVSLGLYLIRPEYMGILFSSPTGKIMVTGCIVWMGFGVLMMRQMINFKV